MYVITAHQRHGQTDRQTDGRTSSDPMTATLLKHVAVNSKYKKNAQNSSLYKVLLTATCAVVCCGEWRYSREERKGSEGRGTPSEILTCRKIFRATENARVENSGVENVFSRCYLVPSFLLRRFQLTRFQRPKIFFQKYEMCGQKSSIWGESLGKIEFLSTENLLRRKFAAVCR